MPLLVFLRVSLVHVGVRACVYMHVRMCTFVCVCACAPAACVRVRVSVYVCAYIYFMQLES